VKQTAATGEVGDFLTARDSGRDAKRVDVPVLSVVGDHDTFFIDPTERYRTVPAEPAAYPAQPSGRREGDSRGRSRPRTAAQR